MHTYSIYMAYIFLNVLERKSISVFLPIVLLYNFILLVVLEIFLFLQNPSLGTVLCAEILVQSYPSGSDSSG